MEQDSVLGRLNGEIEDLGGELLKCCSEPARVKELEDIQDNLGKIITNIKGLSIRVC